MTSNLGGKIAFCVGGTSGIGRGVAKRLALLKANVAIAARNKKSGLELIEELKAINPKGTFEVIECEATSMKSINQACIDFGKVHGKLNYLIMTQGSSEIRPRTETSEGIDEKMALHYYGRVQCIRSLESILKATAASEEVRVMSILSGGIHNAYDKLDDLELKKNYNMINVSNAAGFYTDLALDQISRNFGRGNAAFIHSSPGFVQTDHHKSLPFPLNLFGRMGSFFANTPEQCAENMIDHGLISPTVSADVDGSAGFHILKFDGKPGFKTKLHNAEYRQAVWRHTIETLDNALKN